MCLWLCTTSVHNTTQNSSDNLPSYLQTNIIAQMLSIGGEGVSEYRSWHCWNMCFALVHWTVYITLSRSKQHCRIYYARSAISSLSERLYPELNSVFTIACIARLLASTYCVVNHSILLIHKRWGNKRLVPVVWKNGKSQTAMPFWKQSMSKG